MVVGVATWWSGYIRKADWTPRTSQRDSRLLVGGALCGMEGCGGWAVGFWSEWVKREDGTLQGAAGLGAVVEVALWKVCFGLGVVVVVWAW